MEEENKNGCVGCVHYEKRKCLWFINNPGNYYNMKPHDKKAKCLKKGDCQRYENKKRISYNTVNTEKDK